MVRRCCHDSPVRRWTLQLELLPSGSPHAQHRPSRTELRGAVYRDILGGAGHRGWTPWRFAGFSDGPDGTVLLDLLWLPDHYGPATEPVAADPEIKLGSWQVRIAAVTHHRPVDRLEYATGWVGDDEFTVHTVEPVLLTQRIPRPVDCPGEEWIEVIYPSPAPIIRSLAKNWNAAGQRIPGSRAVGVGLQDTDLPILPEIETELIGELCVVSALQDLLVTRELVKYEATTNWRTYKRCFSAAWSMKLLAQGDPVLGWWFALLMRWADWSGIGGEAGAGLGRVSVTPGNTLIRNAPSNGQVGKTDRSSRPRRAAAGTPAARAGVVGAVGNAPLGRVRSAPRPPGGTAERSERSVPQPRPAARDPAPQWAGSPMSQTP